MNCPSCGRKLTIVEAARARCPHCSRSFDRSALGLIKTSSVRVATSDSDDIYQSVEDLPPELRRQLQQALGGPDAETILIADEEGREQIFRVINGLPPHIQKKVLGVIQFAGPPASRFARLHNWQVLLLLASLAGLALLLWWVWLP